MRNKETKKPPIVDVLLVIPLMEELRSIQSVFGGEWEYFKIGSEVYYLVPMSNSLNVVAITLREMGNQPALEQTSSAISIVNPKAVFCLGIGGSLHSDDLGVGDIAVSRAVSDISDAAKISSPEKSSNFTFSPIIRPRMDGTYNISVMGRQIAASRKLTNVIASLPISSAIVYSRWKFDCSIDRLHELRTYSNGPLVAPQVDICHFASGFVVATSNLKLRSSNREYKVIETEGAGVARACTNRDSPVPFVIFRGISDLADETKSKMERGGSRTPKGAWRRIAAKNVARFVKIALESQLMAETIRDSEGVDVTDVRKKALELSSNGKIRFSGRSMINALPIISTILEESINQSVDDNASKIYISAGDLWIARPLFSHLLSTSKCTRSHIYLLTINPEVVLQLINAKVMEVTPVEALIPNLKALYYSLEELEKTERHCELHHAYWEGFPLFHGNVFKDYIWHGQWSVGDNGKLQMQSSEVTIFRKDAFPDEYDRICNLLPKPDAFVKVTKDYLKNLEGEYSILPKMKDPSQSAS